LRLAVAVVVSLVVAACGAATADTTTPSESEPVTTTVVQQPAETTSPATQEAIGTAETALGTVLVDAGGATLYVFDIDESGESACYDQCADNWPPVKAGLTAGDGVDVTAGTTTRTDGTDQLTVNGRPVYLFAGDANPGDVNGHGVNDVWFAVDSNGDPVDEALDEETTDQGGYDY